MLSIMVRRSLGMLSLIIGFIFGTYFGVLVMCLMFVAKDSDRKEDEV